MKDWKLISKIPSLPFPFLIKAVGFLVILFGLAGCSNTPLIGDDPKTQRFADVTTRALPKVSGSILQAHFATLNPDNAKDLVLFTKERGAGLNFVVLMNNGKGRFQRKDNKNLISAAADTLFFTVADLNSDRISELILLQKDAKGTRARIFVNNGKGYFYRPEGTQDLRLNSGIDRINPMDLDSDHDVDLLFTGKKVTDKNGKEAEYPMQLFINNGKARLVDRTATLMPPHVGQGVTFPVFADYDGDSVVDIFLVSERGPNRLLINNGLGQFTDTSDRALPGVIGKNTHADWADFDDDKDNDLLVTTRGIKKSSQSYPSEYTYLLENDGRGKFKKRPMKTFPNIPSRRVYLLDADGNETVDALILTHKGPHFFAGLGGWSFAIKSKARLPSASPVLEMTFGDINGDHYLDVFAINSNRRSGRLWVSLID